MQKHFPMIDDAKGIMVILLQKYNHNSLIIEKCLAHQCYLLWCYPVLYTLITCKLFCIQFMAWNNFYATEMTSWRIHALNGGLIRDLVIGGWGDVLFGWKTYLSEVKVNSAEYTNNMHF